MKSLTFVLPTISCLALAAQSALAFNPLSRTNVVNYWGQNSVYHAGGTEADLIEYCQDDTVDVFAMAFIYQIQNGVPILNLANHCETTYPGTPHLNCPKIGQDIKACQARGKAVVISIGGATGSYSLPDAASGQAFADQVWNLFLGGSSATRPFGDAILDGVDLDLEHGQNFGYVAFIESLRQKFASAGGSRRFYITAAPQCPYPDQATKDALATSWFDLVWVQFYNNYCGVNNFGTSNFNFDTWNTWATTVSQNKNVRILLGVPGGERAAGSGIVDAATLNTILAKVRTYSNFGGVMMWDAGIARKSGLAASAARFLRGQGALEIPIPQVTAPVISVPAVTRPAIPTITAPAIPVVAPPVLAVPTRVEPQPLLAPTTTTMIASGAALPTLNLKVPAGGQPWIVSVHIQRQGGSIAELQAPSAPQRPMETDWMGRPVKVDVVPTAVPVSQPNPMGFDFVVQAFCQH